MGQPLRLLLIEDSQDDAELLLLALRRSGYEEVTARQEATAEAVCVALDHGTWDVVISDYVMPGFGGLEALELFKQRGLEIPFIIVSGHIGEEVAVAALKAGANDYVMKDRLARLGPAVERALQESWISRAHKRANEALRDNEARLRKTVSELRASEEALRQSNEELTCAREELEKRVQERTADLTAANAELQCQMKERKRLENELLDIAENERRRIGFDLHDDIGQKLMGISLLLKALGTRLGQKHQAEASEISEILHIQELVGQVINHTRDLAQCFCGLDLEGNNLGPQLRKLVTNIRRTFHISVQFHAPGGVPALPDNVALQLYNIAQEALSNAVKHGKGTWIELSLVQQNGRLVLRVENDGIAFPTSYQPSNRMGLRIMNYRAHTIGGTLEVGPCGESGTVVTCELPFATAAGRPVSPRKNNLIEAAIAAQSMKGRVRPVRSEKVLQNSPPEQGS